MKINKTQKGFTLIELLMVVAIIAILSSMILMALNSGRERAEVNRYVSYATQMYRLVGDSVAAGYFDANKDITAGTSYCLGAYTDCGKGGAVNTDLNKTLSQLTELPVVTKDNAYSPYNTDEGVTMAISSDNSQAIIRMYLLNDNSDFVAKVCKSINWTTCGSTATTTTPNSCCTAVSLNKRMRTDQGATTP